MSEDSLVTRTRAVVVAVLGPRAGRLAPAEPLSNLPDWDSVNLMHLLVALEAEFGAVIDPERLPELQSIERIAAVVRGAGAR
jgi:acyl carrier protein